MSEELKATSWIKTSERLPEEGKTVLVYGQYAFELTERHGEVWEFSDSEYCWDEALGKYPFWRPLPEPPEVEE